VQYRGIGVDVLVVVVAVVWGGGGGACGQNAIVE